MYEWKTRPITLLHYNIYYITIYSLYTSVRKYIAIDMEVCAELMPNQTNVSEIIFMMQMTSRVQVTPCH